MEELSIRREELPDDETSRRAVSNVIRIRPLIESQVETSQTDVEPAQKPVETDHLLEDEGYGMGV